MRKVIVKSNRIHNPKLKDWEDLLKSVEFPKEHMNFGAVYCNFHIKKENMDSVYSQDGCSLLPLSLYILKTLNLDEVKEYVITDELSSKQKGMKILDEHIDIMHRGGVNARELVSKVEHTLLTEIVNEINVEIQKSETKILEIGLLTQSIQTIVEVKLPPIVSITYNYVVR